MFLVVLGSEAGLCFSCKGRAGGEELPWPGTGGTGLEWWMDCLHTSCICESPLIQNTTRAKEQKKTLSKITWDKDLENLLLILLESLETSSFKGRNAAFKVELFFFLNMLPQPLPPLPFYFRLQRQSAESFLGMLHLFRVNVDWWKFFLQTIWNLCRDFSWDCGKQNTASVGSGLSDAQQWRVEIQQVKVVFCRGI